MNNKIKLIGIIFSILFLMNFVSAEYGYKVGSESENIGTYKLNKCMLTVQVCSNCSYSKISSIISPNGSVYAVEQAMTKAGTFFSYNFCNVSETGDYKVNGHFDVDGVDQVFNYVMSSTNTGTNPTEAQGGMSLGLIIGSIAIMIFFGFLAFKFLENNKMFGFGLFFLVMSIIFAVYNLFLGFILSRDFLLANISGVQEKVFLAVLIALTGIIFIVFTFLIMDVIKQLKIKKEKKDYGEGYNSNLKTYDY